MKQNILGATKMPWGDDLIQFLKQMFSRLLEGQSCCFLSLFGVRCHSFCAGRAHGDALHLRFSSIGEQKKFL